MANLNCSVTTCDRKARSGGFCNRHYENARRYGHPIAIREWPVLAQLLTVGWDVTEDGCWEWRGAVNDSGYGLYSHRRVHRLMYVECVGPLRDDEEARHRCDNPPCCNPDHLEPGSHAENVRDMVARRRHWMHDRTHCPNGHDLTAPGATKRVKRRDEYSNACVQCDRDRKRRYEERKRTAAA